MKLAAFFSHHLLHFISIWISFMHHAYTERDFVCHGQSTSTIFAFECVMSSTMVKKHYLVNWTGGSICLLAQDKKRKRFFFLQSWLLIICSFICNFNCNHCTIELFRSHLFDFQTFSNDNVTTWRRLTWHFPFDS